MNKIIECAPNFSEGRDALKMGQIVGEIEKVKGVIAHMLGKEVEEWQRGAVGSRVFYSAEISESGLIAVAIKRLGLSQLNKFIPEKKILEYMLGLG